MNIESMNIESVNIESMNEDPVEQSVAYPLEDVVRRLAEVTDELLALAPDDFAARFRLETERDELRAQAAVYHQRKDEGRSTEQLEGELAARMKQLAAIEGQYVNRALQAASASGSGGGGERAMDADHGGTANLAIASGQGVAKVKARIAELEQELARR